MLTFTQETFHSRIVLPNGESADRPIEIRVHPITGRTCRITYTGTTAVHQNSSGCSKCELAVSHPSHRDKCDH